MTHSPPTQSHNPPPALGANGRAVGLDVHPDSFAAAILAGRDPLRARVVLSVTRQPLDALAAWATRHTTAEDPLQKWGLSVALRRGQNKAAECSPIRLPPLVPYTAVSAVARKLTVAIWHVLRGHWNKTLEETTTLLTKLGKLATDLGVPTLQELGYASKTAFQEQKLEVLRTHP
jgi:hypothetical protein